MRSDRRELRFGDFHLHARSLLPIGRRLEWRGIVTQASEAIRPRLEGAATGESENSESDEAVVARVLAGEDDLFGLLVRRYQTRVHAHVAKMIGHRDDALDLTQEIFLKVYQALDRFNPEYKFSTWLFRIAGNAAIDHLRKRRLADRPAGNSGSGGPGPGVLSRVQ